MCFIWVCRPENLLLHLPTVAFFFAGARFELYWGEALQTADLAEEGTGEVEDVQKGGVGEVPQTRYAGESQRLQAAATDSRDKRWQWSPHPHKYAM